MSNFADDVDVDLVDDGAPMPGETKPTLKSNPSGTTFPSTIPVSKNNQPTGNIIVLTGKKKIAQNPEPSKRKNASSFMQQPYQHKHPVSTYPKGIPKTFLQEQIISKSNQQSILGAPPGPVKSFIFPPAGIPKAFLTPQHQQQIGKITPHQQKVLEITQQQQQIFQALQYQQHIAQQNQQIGQLPSLMSIDTTKPLQPKTQVQSTNQANTGFKQTFQPIEPQQEQPKTSEVNFTIQKTGEQDNSGNTEVADKPLTKKQKRQQLVEAKKKLRWTKETQKEEATPNTTDAKESQNSAPKSKKLTLEEVYEKQRRIKQERKRKRKRPPKQNRTALNSNLTSTSESSTTATQQQTTAPQQQTTELQETAEENEPRQVYSPSDIYNESANVESEEEENDDGDGSTPGSKRLSAFRRLGPVTQPKKPKMTINWLCNKDVREVVASVEEEDVPVHLRKYIQMSTDDIVVRYLPRWPWINPPQVRRTVSARHSKSVMILEQEQMDDMYKKDNTFFQVSITGYPDTWTKEDVLDTVLDSVKGNSFIPCFIEFSKSECKFLVVRSRTALIQLHKLGFVIKKDDVTLNVIISVITLNVNVLEFVPRLILMKRLSNSLTDTELDLKGFTLQQDVSHFIYFPLKRQANQIELLKLQSTVQWELLTKLDLSYNKLTHLNGFFLKMSTPKLKHLDLSYNNIDKISDLFNCRDLPLKSIALEGNPICNDYIDKEHYVKVLKMLFTELVEIDGINIIKSSEMPTIKQNYCTEEVQPIIERLLEVYFPLLETNVGERMMIKDMYDDNAVLTITHMPRLRYSPIYLDFRSLFKYARILEEDEHLSIKGSSNIVKVLCKWPLMEHDPYTFTVDLMYHLDTTLIFRVSGLFKVVSDSLAEDEPLLHFTRTFVLNSRDGVEYKIFNEMVYWELPSKESVKAAFKSTSVWKRQPSLKLESPPDDELKENLLQIFMNLTQLDRNPSQKCLELKNWHLRYALDYFINLLKLDNLDPLMK